MHLFDALPAWALYGLTFALMLAAAEVGRRVALRRAASGTAGKREHAGTIVAATLGLFAFFLAFAFGAAETRFEARRELVIQDANAIGTTYLRAATLPEPHGSDARRLLREYASMRASVSGAGELPAVVSRTEEIQDELWQHGVAAASESPTPITALFLESLNGLIDTHAERVTVALEHRLPSVVWVYLYLLGILATILVGHDVGIGAPRVQVGLVVLVAAFSMAFVLIAQIDRPFEGVAVSQKVMHDLTETMMRDARAD